MEPPSRAGATFERLQRCMGVAMADLTAAGEAGTFERLQRRMGVAMAELAAAGEAGSGAAP